MASLTQTRLLYQIRRKLTANLPSTARANCYPCKSRSARLLVIIREGRSDRGGGRPKGVYRVLRQGRFPSKISNSTRKINRCK